MILKKGHVRICIVPGNEMEYKAVLIRDAESTLSDVVLAMLENSSIKLLDLETVDDAIAYIKQHDGIETVYMDSSINYFIGLELTMRLRREISNSLNIQFTTNTSDSSDNMIADDLIDPTDAAFNLSKITKMMDEFS